ncbi:MAG: polysaccharide deacetylase family protein [Thermoguttaceae bacterium]
MESGQIQLANHTWSHPDLTTIGSSEIADQLRRNDRFMAAPAIAVNTLGNRINSKKSPAVALANMGMSFFCAISDLSLLLIIESCAVNVPFPRPKDQANSAGTAVFADERGSLATSQLKTRRDIPWPLGPLCQDFPRRNTIPL